ncbi:hypothetical protein [Auraticoccus monumenti]|uniref:Uncharacterized protein n=1 Tax=Auraticoccus monumenti TaxID=675864 RepID=A0A1G6V5S0_9ACTN|nr:hypothetical protein [Auraticoccus monumenti]SDD48942.1 hypothetical protein SAMN04489747_1053 [Auraticoccus monumenti]
MTGAQMISSGVVVMVVVTIAYGGSFLLKVSTGGVATNELQRRFYRAGHGHAGILVILGLVVRLLLVPEQVPGWSRQLADAVLLAAIVMPAGFFLSVLGRDPERPNRLRVLIGVGGALLVVGLLGGGAGLVLGGLATP